MRQGIHRLVVFEAALTDFEYTSVQVSVSEGMLPHRDANNLGQRWTTSLGTFEGGLLWKEDPKGTASPPFHAKGLDPQVKGRTIETRENGIILMELDGTVSHQ